MACLGLEPWAAGYYVIVSMRSRGYFKSIDIHDPIHAPCLAFYRCLLCLYHKQLVHSIPRLSEPSCNLLTKINTIGTFFSIRHCFYSQNGWPWWKSQMSCREECSHSIDFAQKMAEWWWESRDGDHKLSMSVPTNGVRLYSSLINSSK